MILREQTFWASLGSNDKGSGRKRTFKKFDQSAKFETSEDEKNSFEESKFLESSFTENSHD